MGKRGGNATVGENFLDKKYQYWQNQLLDLGKRNKMIQFRETKRATLKLLEPSFEELFDRIVVKEEELTFQRPIDRNSDIRIYSVLALLESLSSPIAVNIGDIKADGSLIERQKTLKQLRSKSRLALDEQGTNILYMVVGFVEWREKNTSDATWIKSPLILVPVSLVLESLNAPYILKKYEDDIVVNPTLAYLFERDYGITLPSFDAEEQSVSDFMEEMEKLVDKRGWRVIRETSLGLVSFLKINMYKDLEKNENSIKQNPIIRAFAGEKNSISVLPDDVGDFDHDAIKANDIYQVVNADSSQQDAILLSQKGVSFVMQGPPGTGKSQTITNIIAQGLADGKKILFVSEKMAALQVVHRRLTEVHLDDFCLSLHSYKANKKEVLAELGKNLELKKFKVKDEEVAKLTELDVLKESLKKYVKDIHTEIMPLEMSLYEVYGEIMALASFIDLPLELSEPEKMTKEQVNRYALMISNFDKAKAGLGVQWYKNPWQGTVITNVTYDLTEQIKEIFYRLNYNLNALEHDIEEITTDNEALDLSIKALSIYEEILKLCQRISDIPIEWLKEEIRLECKNIAEENAKKHNQVCKIREELNSNFKSDIFEVSAEKEISKLQQIKRELEVRLCNKYATWNELVLDLQNIYENVEKYYEFINDMYKSASEFEKAYNVELGADIYSLEKYIRIVSLLKQRPYAISGWFNCDTIKSLYDLVSNYETALKQKNSLYEELVEQYSSSLFLSITEDMIVELEGIRRDAYCENIQGYTKEQLLESKECINREYVEISELYCAIQKLELNYLDEWGINEPRYAREIAEFVCLLDVLRSDIKPTYIWTDNDKKSLFDETISQCIHKASDFQKIQNIVLEKWDKSAFEIDSESILRRFKTEYTGFFKIFKKTYRQDKKLLQGYKKEIGEKVSDEEAVELLLKLHELVEISQWFEENKSMHQNTFGEKYDGLKTDWYLLKSDKEKFDMAYQIKSVGAKLPALIKKYGEVEQAQVFLVMDYWNQLCEKLKVCQNSNVYDEIEISKGIEQLAERVSLQIIIIKNMEMLESAKITDTILNVRKLFRTYDLIKRHNDSMLKMKEMHPQLREKLGEVFAEENTDFGALYNNIKCVSSLHEIMGLVPDSIKAMIINQDYGTLDLKCTIEEFDEKINEIQKLVVLSMDESVEALLNRQEEIMFQIEELQSEHEQLKHTTQKEMDLDRLVNALADLSQMQVYEHLVKENSEQYKKIFGVYFKQENTEWRRILELLQATETISKNADEIGLSNKQLRFLLSTDCDIERKIQNVCVINTSEKDMNWVYSLFEEKMNMPSWSTKKFNKKIKKCLDNIDTLDAWIDYRDSRKVCVDNCLEKFIIGAEDSVYKDGTLDKIFCKAFYWKWIAAMVQNVESVAQFRARVQNNNVERFRELDLHQLPVAQMRIREKLINGMPNVNNFNRASDEMSVLIHELGKKRKIMPLRKLFRTIPNLLLKLKPCLMMSPLSVSYFLEAETYKFDMVIFDEASQIFPQDAIGAIFRGAQVIIAGDSKQLPPTNFFAASTNNDADYDLDGEDEDEVIYDSILEEATNSLPNRSLLWHYRSRNEDLISFSNQEIYQNKLITFPSSVTKAADSGVEYIYVEDGVYEGRCNITEAKKCVELVREHIIKHPNRSLGIIAFSEKQQSTIEEEINKFRNANPQFESFFDENKDEAFFVKNLENVQGDERDTILFSICYAKDANGRMYMRFGPLGHQGGERRLNVAITRAKENIKLVGSILPSDIDLNKTKSDGVKMLRSYIEFALYGSLTLKKRKNPNALYDKDEFCNGIARLLSECGYKIHQNIGNSDYTIDLAVEHPSYENCFVVGIECDGEAYYMARTVRDREHLRTSILNQMGWKMYRIWSTEWINNYEGEKTRLLAFIDDAIKTYQIREQRPKGDILEQKRSVEIEEIKNEVSKNGNSENNPYEFENYKSSSCFDAPVKGIKDDVTKIATMIQYVVSIEQPIHIELLYRRMAGAFGNEKATKPVRNYVDYVLQKKLKGKIKIVDEFVVMSNFKEYKARKNSGIYIQDIRYIPKQEITQIMLKIISNSYGIERKNLISETALLLGFLRTGSRISAIMNDIIDSLVKSGKIRILDEKIQLMED